MSGERLREPRSGDEVGLLIGTFREMLGSLNDVLCQVAKNVDQVNAGSEQVAQAGQSLSQGSTEQASFLERVAASLNQINSRSIQNSESAAEASSEQITKVVKVIDDIAFQINLLALERQCRGATGRQVRQGVCSRRRRSSQSRSAKR